MRPRDGSGGVGRGDVRVLRAAPSRGRHGAGGRCAARGGRDARVGLCREYERLLPLVRDDAALGRPGVSSDGGFSEDGEGNGACGLGMVRAVWAAGMCGSCGQRRLGVGTAPAGDARREAGDDGRFGLACAACTSASSASCATMRPSSGEALGATGALAWMGNVVAHAASGWLRWCGAWGCAGLAGSASSG
jgi:hypothetical protein